MSTPGCRAPIPLATLVDYWFGELAAAEEQRIEEHLLGCDHCSHGLAGLVALGSGIRSAFREGAARAVISAPFLERMKREGMRVREYPVSPDGAVRCTLGASDDAVVGRLTVRLEGLSRLDLVCIAETGEQRFRLADIPFDPVSGEVIFCPSAAALRKLPAHTDRIRLVAVGADGEKPVADYTFIHTPS